MTLRPRDAILSPVTPRSRRGSGLIGMLLIALFLAVAVTFAIGQYAKSVERGRMEEALSCFGSLAAGQDRYHLANNRYTGNVSDLTTECRASANFDVARMVCADQAKYTLAMTRKEPFGGVGAYTLYFYGPERAAWCDASQECNDLLPDRPLLASHAPGCR